MEQSELFSRLGVAMAIGLLVGLERGWSKRFEEDHQRAAGFRTFALSGLLGGVAALISVSAGGIFLGLVFLSYAAAFTAFHWMESNADHQVSVTSVIAGLLTFLLGSLAVLGDLAVSVAAAVAMTALLAFREQLHRWVATLTWEEVSSVLILLAMTFLLLPLLPNRTLDPWNAVNPYEVWLLTIFIATVSFVGYVAVKIFGERMGILLAAVAGGLASSTATTIALSRLGRQRPESARLLSAGILLAGVIMMARVAVVALLLNAPLVVPIAAPLVAAALVLGICVLLLAKGQVQSTHPPPPIDNPLGLGSALKLGAIIALVMLAVGYLQWRLGSAGVLMVAAVSGVLDVDAITISMARIAGNGLEVQTAAKAILIGVAVNTLSKAVISASMGGRKIGLMVGSASVAALIAGLFVALLLPG